MISCSDNNSLFKSSWQAAGTVWTCIVGARAVLGGLVGREEVGLGALSLTGVPVRDGSWLGIGVISVPISLMDTDLTVGAGEIKAVALWTDVNESC